MDFDFVGSASVTSPDSIRGTRESLPFPEKFEAGYKYVFHRHKPTDKDLLFEALENRFRNDGLNTRMAGLFSGMRFHPDYLSFEGREYKGVLQMYSHQQISRNGESKILSDVFDYAATIETTP